MSNITIQGTKSLLLLRNINKFYIQGKKSLESAEVRCAEVEYDIDGAEKIRPIMRDENFLHILKNISLDIMKGEIVALVGPSGSGKSTLLQIAGLLDKANSGEVIIEGIGCSELSDRKRTSIRKNKIGFVYQFHHLLPDFSALENVIIPQLIAGKSKNAAREHARELLCEVGLSERIKHRPSELSGGEQQRVAIARALANNPVILLADEPTGNLDPENSLRIFDLLVERAKNHSTAMLIATHNMELAAKAVRIIRL